MRWKQLITVRSDLHFKILSRKEFYSQYLRSIYLWIGMGVLPGLIAYYIGYRNEQVSVQMAGILFCILLAFKFSGQLGHLCVSRIMDLYPTRVNAQKSNLKLYRGCVAFIICFPIAHILLFLFLSLKEKSQTKTHVPIVFSKPFICVAMLWLCFLMLPIGIIAAAGLGVPFFKHNHQLNYWTATPTVIFISKSGQDITDTLQLSAKVKAALRTNKLTQAEARTRVLEILDDKNLNYSLLAPVLVSAVAVGSHRIIDENSRSPSSDADPNVLKLEIYQTYAQLLSKWHRKQLALKAINPLAILTPETVLEAALIYSVDLLVYEKIRDEFTLKLKGKLHTLEKFFQADSKYKDEALMTMKLLIELEKT